MTTCTECLRARQLVVHKVYDDGCTQCGIRRLAYMGREERQRKLDEVEFVCGRSARDEVTKMLRLECARIKALSEAMPKDKS